MTVADLIATLQEFDPSLPVILSQTFTRIDGVDYSEIVIAEQSARRLENGHWQNAKGSGSTPEKVVLIRQAPWVRPS